MNWPARSRDSRFEFARFEFARFEFARFEFARFEFARFEFARFEFARSEFARSEFDCVAVHRRVLMGHAQVDSGPALAYVSRISIKQVIHGVKWGLAITAAFVSTTLGACANGSSVPSMAALTSPPLPLTTGSVPELAILGNTPTLNGSVTEVYSRIAGRALTCWFSTDGPLKGSHVFSAEAPPPSSGGSAEITIFEKDAGAANPRGSRAYRMSLTRESDIATRLTLQSGKLPPDLAQALEKDVLAWGVGKDSCEARVVRPPPPPPPVAEKKPQKKKRVAPATAQAPLPADVAKASGTPVKTVGTSEGQPSGQVGPKPAAQPR